MFQNFYKCEYGYGLCKAPNTQCPHWQGIFCELDEQRKGFYFSGVFCAGLP